MQAYTNFLHEGGMKLIFFTKILALTKIGVVKNELFHLITRLDNAISIHTSD